MESNTCISPLATRPILYTDTLNGVQTCRDDLWAVTTEELNDAARAAPGVPAASAALHAIHNLKEYQRNLSAFPRSALDILERFILAAAPAAPAGISQQAGGAVPPISPQEAAMQDAMLFGTGAYRARADGTTEHIPHDELFLATMPDAPNPALAVPVQADRGATSAYSDPVEDVAYWLAVELEGASFDKNELVTVNREKLKYIAKKAIDYASSAAPLPLPEGPSLTVDAILKIANDTGIYRKTQTGWIGDMCKLHPFARGIEAFLAATPVAPPASPSEAARNVLAERQRQMDVEGWTPAHDDEHANGELAAAAASYAVENNQRLAATPPPSWPWDASWWKPRSNRRNLVKAGALILAEIERLDRRALPGSTPDAAQGGA